MTLTVEEPTDWCPLMDRAVQKKGNPFFEFLGVEGYWRFSKETMQKKYEEGLVVKRGNSLYQKYYQSAAKQTRRTVTTWWDDAGLTSTATSRLKELMGGATFDTPKPIELLERMLKMITFSSDDCIVMDFFSGSATLAHAVMNINREYGVKESLFLYSFLKSLTAKLRRELGYDNLCQIGEERIKRAGDLIVSEINESNKQLALGELPITIPDVGFRVLKLDSSGILCPEPGRLLLERVKPDRTDQDIILK
ncbi:DNA methyltransferase [Trueperella pyogenes]|uniref:DNA methyltransferase n=1 Tax=Trueperella pyogenes TaxID=1661 RepID=UPI00143311A0|nr:DNA methyltransferase [Trueperella pyogenes]QIU86690.1 site-specific DNA-methyltransferase [Trueperella pyogenes]